MENLRRDPISEIAKDKVIAIRDYLIDIRINSLNNEKEKMNMPISNVLYYELEKNGWVCVRPSGTEPKIKIYMGVKENSLDKSLTKLEKVKNEIRNILERNL